LTELVGARLEDLGDLDGDGGGRMLGHGLVVRAR
jgi:hypothetical protein